MDLVEQMAEPQTAAQHQVRKLRARLDELTDRGERWGEEGRKVSRQLDLAVVQAQQEAAS